MSHSHQTSGSSGQPHARKLHKDWRVWAGVILMLACMAIYLLTMDNALVPASTANTNAPAHP